MKNKIKYFIVIPVLILLLISVISNVDIVALGVRLVFGESYWKDSLTNTIVTNKSIRLQPGDSLYYGTNSVAVSAGGGDAYLGNRQTFTKRNIFSDTLKADGLSLMEQVRIADWFQVNGDVISNFMFIKGSRVYTGTSDNYGYVIKTADTNRVIIDSLGNVTINKNLEILGGLTVTNDISTLGDVTGNNINGQISASSITSGSLDTARIPNTAKIDTAKFAHTDTLLTENVKGIWTFWNIVRCIGIVTFDASPVFNALVNFANGITTTTFYASGYSRFGELSRNEKKVTKAVYLSSTNVTYTVAHGISRVENVTSVKLTILHDSTGAAVPQILPQGYNATTPQAVGNSVWLDSLNCNYYLATTSYGLIGDSAKFEITYTDAY